MSGLRTLSWAFTVLLVLTSGQNQQRLGSPARTLRDVLLGTGRGGMRAPVVEETDHCQGEHRCTGHWIQPWGKGMDVVQGMLPAACQGQQAALGLVRAELLLPSPAPAYPDLTCCCYDCYGNNFNMFHSSEMLCLALFGWKAA